MKPELPSGRAGRAALAWLAALAALKATALVLVAEAIATAVAQLAAGGAADIPRLLLLGLGGTGLRAVAAWGTKTLARRAALGAKERLRGDLVAAALEDRLRRRPNTPQEPGPNAPQGPGADAPEGPGAVAALASRGLDALDNHYATYLPALVSAAVVPLVVGLRILLADWVSALVVVLTVPLVPVFMVLIGKHTEERVAQAAAGLDRLSNHLVELARGLPALVGLRRAGPRRRALHEVSEAYRAGTLGTLRTAFVSGLALELIATISVAVVAVFIGLRLVHGDMALAPGLLVLMLAPECFAPLRELGSAFHSAEDGREALARARRLLEASGAPNTGTTAAGTTDAVAGAPGPCVLALEALQVHYEGAPAPAVAGFSLALPAGGAAVLSTASGTGKTSILRAVAGQLGPNRMDAASRATVGGTVRRRPGSRTAWIPQHPSFSEATVGEELELYAAAASGAPAGAGGAGTAAAVAAALGRVNGAHLAQARIADCSPGELRRAAVARALVVIASDPAVDLLLADEPTAHLDPASAQAVRQALAGVRGRVAVLAASHDSALAHLLGGPSPEQQTPEFPAPETPATPDSVPQEGAGAHAPVVPLVPLMPVASVASAAGSASLGSWRSALAALPWRSGGLLRGVLLAAAAALAAAGLSGVSGWLIVAASHQPPVLHLMVAIVGVRFFGIGRALLRYLERLAVHDAVLRWSTDLRVRVWDALACRPSQWGRLARGGAVLGHLVGDIDEVRDAAPRAVVPLPAALLAWAATATAIHVVAPAALPAALAAGALGFLALPLVVLRIERRAGAAAAAQRSWLAERVAALFAAAPDLAANGAGEEAVRRFRAADARASLPLRRAARGSGAGQAAAALSAGAAAVGAVALVQPGAGAGEMAAVAALLLLALGEPFGSVAESVRELPVLRDRLRRVGDLLGTAGEEAPLAAGPVEEAGASGPLGGLRLRAATLGWGAGPDVAGPLEAEVLPGRWLAVAGPSGAGKSTVVAGMLGILRPRAGALELLEGSRGVDPWAPGNRARGAALAAQIAWCPQEAHLFDSSLAANLGLGRAAGDPATEREMAEALRMVGLGSWFGALPQGLATRIGPGGHKLSGGQRQRVAVARALVARARVVLLDEPTAHLGEDEALDLMEDLRVALADRAVVLVTHDERLAARADAVMHLSGRPAPAPAG